MMRIVAIIMVVLMVTQTTPVKAFDGDSFWGPIVSNEHKTVFHTVRLFANEEELPALYVKDGASIGSLPKAPSMDDMIFAGWFADEEEITEQTVVLSDMEITAVYLAAEEATLDSDNLTEDGLYVDPVTDSDFDVEDAAYLDPETHEIGEALARLQTEKVQVSVLYGSIPDEVNFKQYTQEETDELIARYGLGARSRSSSTASGYTAFDVAMLQADGETYVGDGLYSVNVELDFNVQDIIPAGAQIDQVNYTLHHIHEDTVEELEVSIDGKNITFTTESFSPFVLQYTVDFHYEIDGQEYTFTLPGGGYVGLSGLLEILGVGRETSGSSQ